MTGARRGRPLAACLAVALALPVAAQDAGPGLAVAPGAAAADAADRLRAAEALHAGATGARDRIAALSQTIAAYEAGLEALRSALRGSALREARARAELAAEEARLMRLTGLMLTLDRETGAGMVLHPEGALPSVRAGMVLADVQAALAVEAADLAARLSALSDIRAEQDGALALLDAGLAAAQAARVDLSEAAAERRALPAPYLSDPAALARLLTAADTLDAFAAGLAEVAPAAVAATPDFAASGSPLPLPVGGTVLRRFGEADAAGVARPGLVIATAPGAPVMAPWAATVRYAGALLDYANVIVLEPQPGYLIVLAGLGDLYAGEGMVVAPGTVVASMPGSVAGDVAAGEPGDGPGRAAYFGQSSVAGGAYRTETLYMEIRKSGAPVDPAPWFEQAGDATR
ncbi:MAG: peptidoglycan DD-metalloendopeptidase family protein [Rhodobacteraceae bacterium]|jgi:septal ring factor EnvC (AmiA/AmiB activator)|nr:peptidoglycan DD-metalloendopeptidase family protein [Paracoccaceae bacterium]